MVSKIIALGKEISLPVEISDDEAEKNVMSLIADFDPELAKELENVEYETRIENDTLVVYRSGAVFG